MVAELSSSPCASAAGQTSEQDLALALTSGDRQAFEALMRRHNQRLFRVARAITGDSSEAEDAVQSAYLSAYLHLASFAGRSSVATWLTRIAINEALARRRARRARERLDSIDWVEEEPCDRGATPEEAAALKQQAQLVERAIDGLPATYRLVLMLRQVQGLSSGEVAASLAVSEEVVRVRLHRARAMLRERLGEHWAELSHVGVFEFAGERCNRIVAGVLVQVGFEEGRPGTPPQFSPPTSGLVR